MQTGDKKHDTYKTVFQFDSCVKSGLDVGKKNHFFSESGHVCLVKIRKYKLHLFRPLATTKVMGSQTA